MLLPNATMNDKRGIINNTFITDSDSLIYYNRKSYFFGILIHGKYIVDLFLDEKEYNDSIVIECIKILLEEHEKKYIRVLINNNDNPFLGVLILNFQVINAVICDHGLLLDISNLKESNYSVEKEFELKHMTKKIMQRLRTHYYRSNTILEMPRTSPLFGKVMEGMPTDSLGPFPEFILPTLPCKKTLEGYCTPCFFSKVEMNPGTREEKMHSLVDQTKYIINNYDSVVNAYQCRNNEDPILSKYDVTICFACNGSFFSDYETTAETRRESLQLLNATFKEKKQRPLVYIESCVDDYYRFIHSSECELLLPILKELNAFILFGFESADHFVRDILYYKDMDIVSFEKVLHFNTENNLGTGAFLYRGFHSLTQTEIISDTVISLYYLMTKKVMPVIMLPNLQEFTLTHLLYIYKKYNVLDPITALSIVELTVWFNNKKCSLGDNWLMGDLFGGPPTPKCSVFSNPRRIVCDECSNTIRRTLQKVRKNKDMIELYHCREVIKRCHNNCYEKYQSLLSKELEISIEQPLFTRANDNIVFANRYIDDYLIKIKKHN